MVLKPAFGQPLAYVRNEGFRTANFAWPFRAFSQLQSWRAARCRQPRALTVVSAPHSSNRTCLFQSSGSRTAFAAGIHALERGRAGSDSTPSSPNTYCQG